MLIRKLEGTTEFFAMSQVLYRKYRSKSMGELVGQEHITAALTAAIAKGAVAHAYLFTGPRGTGKTSVARILAHAVNGFTYDESATNLDIIEIDAASNRRIDEIRDLRDKVHIAPSIGKYKVYIIDEVHMLTKEAFNALLKTLEEPPSHVIFILATTDLHKVPDTIISRTQRYSFRPIEASKIVEHLAYIAKEEGIEADPGALELIAQHADGGFRDAISLLDQTRHSSAHVTAESVLASLGMPSAGEVDSLWAALTSNTKLALESLDNLYNKGFYPSGIASQLLAKAIALGNVAMARNLLVVQSSHDPKNELLLVILEANTTTQPTIAPQNTVAAPETHPAKSSKPKIEDKAETSTPTTDTKNQTKPETTKPVVNTQPSPQHAPNPEPQSVETPQSWPQTLEHIREAGHAVYGPLRLAEAELDGDTLKLYLSFPFHIKRINDGANIKMIAETYKEVSGETINIEVIHRKKTETDTPAPKKPSTPRPAESAIVPPKIPEIIEPINSAELQNDPLSMVKNVFGGAVVL
jgi:DNA polymerase III subunit gamma/tau